jgi:hypothetical protein
LLEVSPPCSICPSPRPGDSHGTEHPGPNLYARRRFLAQAARLIGINYSGHFWARCQTKPDRSRGEPFRGAEAQQIEKF